MASTVACKLRTDTLATMVDFAHREHRQDLESLLDEELAFDATTTNGLTSHLPMALVAKNGLGAPREELRRFAERYKKRLAERSPEATTLTSTTWRSAVGREGSFDDLCVYFVKAVNDEGADATIRTHLDALTPGICGAAFHGALRLAYALELASPHRIAAGLAYLAESAVPLGAPMPKSSSSEHVIDVLARLSSTRTFADLPSRGLISEEMQNVAAMDEFRDAVGGYSVDDHTLEALRAAALTLFATTGDFTSLHAVTGVEALTALRPYAQDKMRFDTACLTGVAAAYATVGAPALASSDQLLEFSASNPTKIDDVAHVGAMSDDEHVSKLVYTSLRLQASTQDDLYLAVAARKAGLHR
jgi:hypothetical protein